MMRRVFAGLALALAFTASCSKASQTPGTRSSTNVMTREEILAAPEGNLYDTVQRLRPGFLRARSTATTSNAYPVVYVNNQRRGSLEYLRAINNREVVQVRYIS